MALCCHTPSLSDEFFVSFSRWYLNRVAASRKDVRANSLYMPASQGSLNVVSWFLSFDRVYIPFLWHGQEKGRIAKLYVNDARPRILSRSREIFRQKIWKSKLSSFAARKRSIGNQRTKLLHMSAPQGSAVDKMAVKKRTIGQSVCTDPLRGSVWFHQFWSRNFSGSKVDSKWSCSLGLILVWL